MPMAPALLMLPWKLTFALLLARLNAEPLEPDVLALVTEVAP